MEAGACPGPTSRLGPWTELDATCYDGPSWRGVVTTAQWRREGAERKGNV